MNTANNLPKNGMTIFRIEGVFRGPGKFQSTEVKKAVKEVHEGHHLEGQMLFIEGKVLILAKLPLQRTNLVRDGMSLAMAYGWDGQYGSGFTFTLVCHQEGKSPAFISRVYVPFNHPDIQRLRDSEIFVSFVTGYKISLTAKLLPVTEEHKEGLDYSFNVMEQNEIAHHDQDLHYWELLRASPVWNKFFQHNDFLSVGWFDKYSNRFHYLRERLKVARQECAENPAIIESLPSTSKELMNAVIHGSVEDAYKYLENAEDIVSVINDLVKSSRALHSIAENLHSTYLLGFLFDTWMNSPRMTKNGLFVPWVDNPARKIKYMEIETSNLDDEQRRNFWPNLDTGLRIDWGYFITADDVPSAYRKDEKLWSKFHLGCPIADAESMADALLEEAYSNKKAVIPAKACVQADIGFFKFVELTEIRNEVYCVFRDDANGFARMSVDPAKQTWAFDITEEIDNSRKPEIEASLKLFIAALIRDFWVIEDRTTVFDRKPLDASVTHRPNHKDDRPIIVYLPRVRYFNEPSLDKCTTELELESRRKHFVRPHLRKTNKASAPQLRLASLYGITVEEGHTFIRPHERGGSEREVIYRSRSALGLLYTEKVSTESPLSIPDWFEFERDVAKLLKAHDFQIEKVASPGRGDAGIDIVAFRKNRQDAELWAIQCKCYSRRAVGPTCVRELIGSMSRLKGDVRGMIVTTTGFTKGAIEEAEEAGIFLVDGDLFVQAVDKQVKILIP